MCVIGMVAERSGEEMVRGGVISSVMFVVNTQGLLQVGMFVKFNPSVSCEILNLNISLHAFLIVIHKYNISLHTF